MHFAWSVRPGSIADSAALDGSSTSKFRWISIEIFPAVSGVCRRLTDGETASVSWRPTSYEPLRSSAFQV